MHKKEATIDKLNEKLKAAIDDREGSHQMSADVAEGTAGEWEGRARALEHELEQVKTVGLTR